MVTSPTDQTRFTEWRAANLKHLREIWKGLRADSDEEKTPRTFAGQRLTPEQAGLVFERWVLEAFRLSGTTGHHAFLVPLRESGQTREQIDGLIFDGRQGFLVECKFWLKGVDFGPIALLHTLLDPRPVGTMGLFFSAFGYTVPALESAMLLRPARVLLFDTGDLTWALDAKKTFAGRMMQMVRRKWMLIMKQPDRNVPVTSPLALFD